MMLDVDAQDEAAERAALLAEGIYLAYMVNTYTPFCVFAEYSGHVDLISIRIKRSKEAYNDEIASTEFYTKYQDEERPWKIVPLGHIRAKLDHLKHILREGDIDYSVATPIQEIVTTYEL